MKLSNDTAYPKAYRLCLEYDEHIEIEFNPEGVNTPIGGGAKSACTIDTVMFTSSGRVMLRLILPETFFVDGRRGIYIADDPNGTDEIVIKNPNSALRLVRTREPGAKADD